MFVKNLPYECEEADLTASFMVCGKIAKVRYYIMWVLASVYLLPVRVSASLPA